MAKRHGRLVTVAIYAVVSAWPQLSIGALAVLYARSFSLKEYGAYGVLSAVVTLLGMVADLGFSQAILRNYYDRYQHGPSARTYLGSMILGSSLFSLALSPVMGGMLYLTMGLLGVGDLQWPLICVIALIPFFDRTSDLLGTVCQAMERPDLYAIGRAVQALMSLVAGYILVFSLHGGVLGAFAAIAIAKAASAVIYQYIAVKKLQVTLRKPDWVGVFASLGFGLPILVNRSATWARRLALRPLLTHVVPISAVGAFSFAAALAELPGLLGSGIDLAFGPVYYRGRVGGDVAFRHKAQVFAILFAAGSFPIWSGFILFSREIIRLSAGPRYEGATAVCAFLMCATFVRVQSPFLVRQIGYLRRTWLLPVLTIPCGVLSIAATVLFGHAAGILVAGISILAAETVLLTSLAAAVGHFERLDYPLLTALMLTAVLTVQAAWVGIGEPVPPHWSVEASKAAILIIDLAAAAIIWGLPNREFLRRLLRG
jgi:O-antigen/teichoic acid export membrane protein